MKTLLLTLATITTITTLASAARAEDAVHHAYAGVAMDTTVVSKLGYELDLGRPRPRLELSVPATLTVPMLGPGGDDAELRAGARVTLRAGGRLVLGEAVQPLVRSTRNRIYRATAVGVDVELTPTIVLGRWAAGGELGYDKGLLLHLHHTQAFRDRVYADVVDGWYQSGGGTLRGGVRVAVRAGTVQLRLRAGMTMTEGGNAQLVPFYAELGAAIAL